MDPLTAAATLGPMVIGAFRRPKRPNRGAILSRYRNSRPTGYTSPEDEAFAERQRVKGAGAAKAVAKQRRAINAGQVTSRGLGGAAAAALEQQATDVEAAGSEEAARTSSDLLYRAFQSNLGYERQKNDNAFGAELGIANEEAARADANNASFWNSVLEATTAVAPMIGSMGATAPGPMSERPSQTAQAPNSTFSPAHRSPGAPAGAYTSTEYR